MTNQPKATVAVTTTQVELSLTAHKLAKELQLPFAELNADYDYFLCVTPDYLCLQKKSGKFLPLYVDFLSEKITFRRQHATLRNETLVRALGLKKTSAVKIVDATAGLGQDSFILASLGFDITLIERSPIIYSLLNDGMHRAEQNPETQPIIKRLHLIHADTITWLQTQVKPPDMIYLDPMFPHRKKSALAKKEMLFFQEIVGQDPDAETLLATSLTCALKRVVVKRPRLAKPIKGIQPSFNIIGSSSRFDIYLTEDHHGKLTPSL